MSWFAELVCRFRDHIWVEADPADDPEDGWLLFFRCTRCKETCGMRYVGTVTP